MKRRIAWILVIVGLAGLGGIYWWLESSTRPATAGAPDVEIVSTVIAPGSAPVRTIGAAPVGENPQTAAGNGTESDRGESKTSAATVGDILAEPDDNYVRVAKKLLAITTNPSAPLQEREEALAHALNLSAGNEAEVLMPLIKDANLPDAMAETVLAEALNRPLAFQADLYLAALGARKSPELQTSIREHLAFLTGGDDKGANPADWAEAIKTAKASWPE